MWIFLFSGIVSISQARMTRKFSPLSVFESKVSQTVPNFIRRNFTPSNELEKLTINPKPFNLMDFREYTVIHFQ